MPLLLFLQGQIQKTCMIHIGGALALFFKFHCSYLLWLEAARIIYVQIGE